MITLQQFIDKYQFKKIDWDKAYGAQCFDLYRFYLHEVLGFQQSPPTGDKGAALIWTNYIKEDFTKIPNTPDGIPKPGSIMIWNRYYGPYGHVAVVVSADVNKFTAFSQNDPTGSACILKEYEYSKIYGWLEPVDNTVDNSERYKEERDKCSKELGETLADLEQQKTITSETKKELNTFMETLAGKLKVVVDKNEIIGAVERVLEVESQLEVANKKIIQEEKKHELEKDELKVRIDDLSKAVDQSLKTNETLKKRLEELEKSVNEKIIVKTEFSIFGWLKRLINKVIQVKE